VTSSFLSLQGFGKVYIRGEKFDESLNERIDGLELNDVGQARATQVRQVLRLMLAYEVAERPSAQQVVELMEALAEEVNDGSLRRFCREVVGPAHQMVDASNPNGTFSGSTLFEDSSRVREEELEDVEARVIAEVAESGDLSTKVLPVQTGAEYLSDPLVPEIEATDVAEGGYAAYAAPGAPTAGTAVAGVAEPKTSTGGGKGLILLAVLGLCIGVAVLYTGFNTFVQPAPDPGPEEVVDAPKKYKSGGSVDTNQAGGSGGALSLQLSGDKSAKVTVSAALSGFNYKWDGTGKLKLDDLQEGPYRIRIKTDGASIVLQSKVETGRTCAYRYDLEGGGEDWDKSGC